MNPIPALSCRPVLKAEEKVSKEKAAAKLNAFLEQARPLACGRAVQPAHSLAPQHPELVSLPEVTQQLQQVAEALSGAPPPGAAQ